MQHGMQHEATQQNAPEVSPPGHFSLLIHFFKRTRIGNSIDRQRDALAARSVHVRTRQPIVVVEIVRHTAGACDRLISVPAAVADINVGGGVAAVDVGNAIEADILSRTGNDLRRDLLAVLIVAYDISCGAFRVLTGSTAADSLVVRRATVSAVDDDLGAVERIAQLLKLVHKSAVDHGVVALAALAGEFADREMR